MHTTKRLWGLGLIAILVAACSTTGGEASAAIAVHRERAARHGGPGFGGPVRGGRHLHGGRDADRHPGHVHDRHRQPGIPAVLRDRRSHRTDPWELGDPTTGNGFESAFAYALAEELGFDREAR